MIAGNLAIGRENAAMVGPPPKITLFPVEDLVKFNVSIDALCLVSCAAVVGQEVLAKRDERAV